jgi:hypothetical protein
VSDGLDFFLGDESFFSLFFVKKSSSFLSRVGYVGQATDRSESGARGMFALLLALPSAFALQNGAALTPPMGWLSWQRYGCTVACQDATSKDCLNERLIRDTADAMASLGYKDAGYEYVLIGTN